MKACGSAAIVEPAASSADRAQSAAPVVLALLLGAFFLYGAGFAQPNALHSAAHDSRHAFAFPCH